MIGDLFVWVRGDKAGNLELQGEDMKRFTAKARRRKEERRFYMGEGESEWETKGASMQTKRGGLEAVYDAFDSVSCYWDVEVDQQT